MADESKIEEQALKFLQGLTATNRYAADYYLNHLVAIMRKVADDENRDLRDALVKADTVLNAAGLALMKQVKMTGIEPISTLANIRDTLITIRAALKAPLTRSLSDKA